MINIRSKILAFFASDLILRRPSEFLRRASRSGYTLLPLDSPAIVLAANADLPYVTLEEILDPEIVLKALSLAEESNTAWFEPAKEEFSVNGLCLPAVDRNTMIFFWQEVMLALELAAEIKRRKFSEFMFFKNLMPSAKVAFKRSDVSSALWHRELPGIVRPLIRAQLLAPGYWRPLLHTTSEKLKESVRRSHTASDHEPCSVPQNAVFVVMGPQETHRFSHVLEQLCQRFPGKILALIAGSRDASVDHTISHWKIAGSLFTGRAAWPRTNVYSSLPFRFLPRIDAELEGKFARGYENAIRTSVGKPWHKPLAYLAFHFMYHVRYRWPYMWKTTYTFFDDLWRRTRPRAVVVSSRGEMCFELASEAARLQGIPTFTVPHGTGLGRRQFNHCFSDFIILNNRHQAEHSEHSGFPRDRMKICSGLVAPSEYPVQAVRGFRSSERVRVLAITDPIEEGETLMNYTSPSAQLSALRAFVRPPEAVAGRVELKIKLNPFFPNLELIQAAGPEVVRHTLPVNSDLLSVLQETDLVVALNYCGAAMHHCLLAGKPIIYFLTEPAPLLRRPDFRYDAYAESTEVERNPADFWSSVTRFISDPGFGDRLRDKARNFARQYLENTGYPSLPDIIDSCTSLYLEGSGRSPESR
ncbi:MAG: hypothetical protein HY912_24485 [Desulfomonile tiedjei]|uniref:Uncharacterized protein n=1 Tax=Desulfomonile tiedjei TaxID=2358 RepID=A0A9D6V5U8_9BACT|nr:hypothetical protein [Desulfomonile tiedjei]